MFYFSVCGTTPLIKQEYSKWLWTKIQEIYYVCVFDRLSGLKDVIAKMIGENVLVCWEYFILLKKGNDLFIRIIIKDNYFSIWRLSVKYDEKMTILLRFCFFIFSK